MYFESIKWETMNFVGINFIEELLFCVSSITCNFRNTLLCATKDNKQFLLTINYLFNLANCSLKIILILLPGSFRTGRFHF